jgi:hypothetical protein
LKNNITIALVLALFFTFTAKSMAQPEIFAIGTEIKAPMPKAFVIGDEVETNASPFLESVLYSIDPVTAAPTMIGPVEGFTRCTGLDIHPQTGEFFAVCEKIEENGEKPILLTNGEEFNVYLLKLDQITAAPLEVGAIQLSRGDFISDISFRQDGTLFAHLNSDIQNQEEEVTTNTIAANSLGIIDTQTAALTILGPTGSEDAWSAIGFNNVNSLIQCTDNRKVPSVANLLNQTTGHATFLTDLIYPIDFNGWIIIPSKDFDNASNQFYGLLAHLTDTVDDEVVTNDATEGNFLVTIDQFSGHVSNMGLIADISNQFGALAVRSELIINEVPTLSEYGLIATVVLLLGASVVFLRRRQLKSNI